MPKKKKEKPKIEWKTAYQIWEERQFLERLATNTPLDNLIGGGIQQTEVVEYYGDYGSGKTQICKTLTVLVASKDGEVIYIDAENTFKPERVAEIALNRGLDPHQILGKIHLSQPLTTDELFYTLDQIPENLKPTLIIVDSITGLYREEYIGRGTLAERQGALRQFIVKLKKYVRENNCYGIVTNQIYANPEATLPYTPLYIKQVAVGGPTLYHAIDNRIFLRKAKANTRIARLMDSSRYPEGEATFVITKRGVEPRPEDQPQQDEKEADKDEP